MLRTFRYLLICFLISNTGFAAQKKTITIGSGSILEGYYTIGLKLCEFFEKSIKGIECKVMPTNGSVENILLLKDGKIDIALTQSNLALEAYNATGYFAGSAPAKNFRQMLRLHDEIFTVISKDVDNIKVFGSIEGKKITNGKPDSASSVTYNELVEFYNFAKEPTDMELSSEDYAEKLCNRDVDTIILMSGHPNALVSNIAYNCEIDFVSIESGAINRLIAANPAYHKVTLHEGFYPGITEDQQTVAVSAMLLTTDKLDADIEKHFMHYFENHIDSFRRSHPVLYNLHNEHFTSSFILPKI